MGKTKEYLQINLNPEVIFCLVTEETSYFKYYYEINRPLKKGTWSDRKPSSILGLNFLSLTPNSSLKQTSLTYPKLNMDDFSALTGQLGQVHMAKEIFPIFLHAE